MVATLTWLVLALSDKRYQAHKHPELIATLAIYQAAHDAYLERLQGVLSHPDADYLGAEEQGNARLVIEGPFQTFKTFSAFSTLLPLILLKRDELLVTDGSASDPQLTDQAIAAAWETFFGKRLLRRNFDSGDRMICPANQYFRYAKDHQQLERIFHFVTKYHDTPVMAELLKDARTVALKAIVSAEYYHWHFKGEALYSNKKARGGKGLRLDAA